MSFAAHKRHLALFAMANLLHRRVGLADGCYPEQYAAAETRSTASKYSANFMLGL
jgi:hypothetical protein